VKKADAKKRIEALRAEIVRHGNLYYTLDAPEISDEAYDALAKELAMLEAQYPEFKKGTSVTERIGGDILEGFEKTRHIVKQWSYDNVFSFDELKQWEERNRKILEKQGESSKVSYITELKIDGLKIVLTYKDGKLVTGATRGDGVVGEDITENIKRIKSIPHTVAEKRLFVAIGECWMEKGDLKKINEERAVAGLPLYANPRNLAAGTLRQLDTRIVAGRNLKTFFYDIEFPDLKFPPFETHKEELDFLKELGFIVNPHGLAHAGLETVQKEYEKWVPRRDSEEYGIDGLVIKMNETAIRPYLGYTAKSPRFGIAYFIPAVRAGRDGVCGIRLSKRDDLSDALGDLIEVRGVLQRGLDLLCSDDGKNERGEKASGDDPDEQHERQRLLEREMRQGGEKTIKHARIIKPTNK
jgi:DNA ligase (NAD+)